CGLLVAVTIERNAALLRQDQGIVLQEIESITSEVGFHGSSSFLAGEDDAGVHSGGRVFVESNAEALSALGLIKIVEGAHFRFVIGAARDFRSAGIRKLAVSGGAVTQAVEVWFHAQCFAGQQRIFSSASD